ncbi:uncharacterized protein LOC121972691 [Zingiber officinale]|uniref:uncharacterized protein LOC121972691 n=1 Tax=Zingiber officinale TaxID=94328 RepID=UPI001C4A97D1|nr:uncharacterized protein LOC121972691 [Zingiber officinale]
MQLGTRFCCCLGGVAAGDEEGERTESLIRSSATRMRSRAQEMQEEIGGRCRSLMARIGRHHNRRRGPCDFGYDSVSYALNFDEGMEEDEEDAPVGGRCRYRNFASRLPDSPPPPAAAVVVAS